MSVKVEQITHLLQSTLPLFISQTPMGWLNEMSPKTFLIGKMLSRAKKNFSGGKSIDFDVLLDLPVAGKWVGAYEKMELQGVRATTRGSVPWRFYQCAHVIDLKERDLNQGTRQVVYDIYQSFKEQVCTSTVDDLETTLMSYSGNYTADGQFGGDAGQPALGPRYWFTPDGLHITGDSSKTVGGINPTTKTKWKNPYINPTGASDGMPGIKHVRELPEAMERLSLELRFESPNIWGPITRDIKHAPKLETDNPATKSPLLIFTDRKTSIKYRNVLFDARDDVSRDQFRGRPVWHGVVVDYDEKLGVPSSGWGYDANGNLVVTEVTGGSDRPSGFTGLWKNAGEMYFFNADYFFFVCHPKYNPMTKKPYMPEGMFALALESTFWLQTVCRSRRRAGGVIIGYNLDD